MNLFSGGEPLLLAQAMANELKKAHRNSRKPTQVHEQEPKHPPGPAQRLAEAAKCGNVAEVESLLRAGVKLKHQFDPSGGKMLMLACTSGHADVVASLLAHGIASDARGDESKRFFPIHIAANRGDLGMLAVLIDAGADVNAADDDGNTPAHMVAAAANEVCLLWLQRKGADTTALNNAGLTPFQLAASLHGDTVFTGRVLSLRSTIKTFTAQTAPVPPAAETSGPEEGDTLVKTAPPSTRPPTPPSPPAAAAAAGGSGGDLALPPATTEATAAPPAPSSSSSPSEAAARPPKGSPQPGLVGAFPPPISLSIRRGSSVGSTGSSSRSLLSPRLGTSGADLGSAITPAATAVTPDAASSSTPTAASEGGVIRVDDTPSHYGVLPIVTAGSVRDRDEDGEETQLGRGGFAAVYAATCELFPDQPLAYKKWDAPSAELGLQREEQVIAKLEALRARRLAASGGASEAPLTHIARCLAWVRSKRGFTGILMERAQCSLQEFFKKPEFDSGRPLDECVSLKMRMEWACQVTNALSALHALKVLHRDLKPANCLLRENWEIAVTDFGESRAMGVHTAARADHTVQLTAPGAKTATHIPPESMEQDGQNGTWGRSSDVWQLGLTLYTIFSGRDPWATPSVETSMQSEMSSGLDVNSAWRSVLNWIYLSPDRGQFEDSLGPWPPCVPAEVRSIVLQCLQTEARGVTRRPKASEVLVALREQQALLDIKS